MNKLLIGAGVLGGLIALGAVLPEDTKPTTTASSAPSPTASAEPSWSPEPSVETTYSPPVPQPSRATTIAPTTRTGTGSAGRGSAPTAGALLYAASGGDGDSWKDRQGREYRMGLINTPEYNECYGSTATAKRKAMVANGFRAKVYATDRYGRRVSVITTASGINLNVYLARHGYANDKYLATFRHENPTLARQLDSAFAAAKAEKVGLWGVCSGNTSGSTSGGSGGTTGSSSSCHPDYKTCIPIKGDGSGNGQENDLDCGEIGKTVYLRQVGVDPYRLDADGDGVGCE